MPRPAAGMTAFRTFMAHLHAHSFPKGGRAYTSSACDPLVVLSGSPIRGSPPPSAGSSLRSAPDPAGGAAGSGSPVRRGPVASPLIRRPRGERPDAQRDTDGTPVGSSRASATGPTVLGIRTRSKVQVSERHGAAGPLARRSLGYTHAGHAHLRIRLQELRTPLRDRAVDEGRSAHRMPRMRRASCARCSRRPPSRSRGRASTPPTTGRSPSSPSGKHDSARRAEGRSPSEKTGSSADSKRGARSSGGCDEGRRIQPAASDRRRNGSTGSKEKSSS